MSKNTDKTKKVNYLDNDELTFETLNFIKTQKYKQLSQKLNDKSLSKDAKDDILLNLKLGDSFEKYKMIKSLQVRFKNSQLLREKYPRINKNIGLKLSAIMLNAQSYYEFKNYNTNRFGELINLMIKNIMKRPNFSGYTYKDEFYFDAVEKIIKYIHNFNPKKATAFNYISTYIHNSFVSVINSEKKKQEEIKNNIEYSYLDKYSTGVNGMNKNNTSKYNTQYQPYKVIITQEDLNTSDLSCSPYNLVLGIFIDALNTIVETNKRFLYSKEEEVYYNGIEVSYPDTIVLTLDNKEKMKDLVKKSNSTLSSISQNAILIDSINIYPSEYKKIEVTKRVQRKSTRKRTLIEDFE